MSEPQWKQMTKDIEPEDGSAYILAFRVRSTSKEFWQIEKLEYIDYDDGGQLYYTGDSDPFTDWEFHDAEFYMKCEDV